MQNHRSSIACSLLRRVGGWVGVEVVGVCTSGLFCLFWFALVCPSLSFVCCFSFASKLYRNQKLITKLMKCCIYYVCQSKTTLEMIDLPWKYESVGLKFVQAAYKNLNFDQVCKKYIQRLTFICNACST